MERQSNRKSYNETRNKYYDQVISMFESGMIAKEIIQIVPVGKSTVYRWFEEYVTKHKGADIRKSPKKAAEAIRLLRSRVEHLETVCSAGDECIMIDKDSVNNMLNEIKAISVDLISAAGRLGSIAEKLLIMLLKDGDN